MVKGYPHRGKRPVPILKSALELLHQVLVLGLVHLPGFWSTHRTVAAFPRNLAPGWRIPLLLEPPLVQFQVPGVPLFPSVEGSPRPEPTGNGVAM